MAPRPVLATLALLLALGACAPDRGATPAQVSPAAEDTACAALSGARFRSRAVFPAGLGPDGPVPGHQWVSFSVDGRQYQWTFEDMSFSSGCSCAQGEVRASGAAFTDGRAFTAHFDVTSGVLTWNEIAFERAP